MSDCEERNDTFRYIVITKENHVFRGIILRGDGLCYNSYLKDLDKVCIYNPIQIEKDYERFLEEMFLIDYREHNFLVDFQDDSDEPLF